MHVLVIQAKLSALSRLHQVADPGQGVCVSLLAIGCLCNIMMRQLGRCDSGAAHAARAIKIQCTTTDERAAFE